MTENYAHRGVGVEIDALYSDVLDQFELRVLGGWPLPALQQRPWLAKRQGQRGLRAVTFVLEAEVRISEGTPRHLFDSPILPGFAVNTLFYATLLWLLIPGPFVLRRFLRLQRGLCPKCAYPMGESAVCSECGTALPTRVKSS